MTPNHDSVKAGVAEAWNWWLSQHDISVPETIHDAVEAAVKNWLNLHADDLFQEAVAGAARTAGFAGVPTGWASGVQPWIRRAPKAPVVCYFCGATSAIVSWMDEADDDGRVEVYCTSGDCEVREAAVVVMRDGAGANLRADVRALEAIDLNPALGGRRLLNRDELDQLTTGRVERRQRREP